MFLHAVQTLNNGKYRYVTADILDTDNNGKFIEHWDVIAEMRGATSSGRTEVDGPTEPTDLAKTENNKLLVSKFLDELKTGNLEAISDYMAADCAQHKPDVPDGSDAFQKFVQQTSMRYIDVHNVLGSGS